MANWHTCRRIVVFLALCLLGADARAGQQPARDLVFDKTERKLALVIGNDSYPRARLQNARNDARAVASALRELGFTVTSIEDANRDQIESAVARFGETLRPTDVAWFFYAGHGLQVGGENYLIPVDFTGDSQTAVRLSALPVTELQNAFSKAQVSVVVLDACRNNPFLATRSSGGGLAPIEARGSLVSFSTGAGQTASDNAAKANGLFTQELLAVIREPGLSIRDMFFKVRQRVFQASNGDQFPAVYDGLVGNLVLRPLPANATTAAVVETPQRPAPVAPQQTAAVPAKSGGGGAKWLLIGGGVAGAAGAGVAIAGGGGGSSTPPANTSTNTPTTTTNTPVVAVKRGDYSGQGPMTYTGASATSNGRVGTGCIHSRTFAGTLTINAEQRSDGSITGTATTSTTLTTVSLSGCSPDNPSVGTVVRYDWTPTLSGTPQNMTFSAQLPISTSVTGGGSVTGVRTLTFQGSLQNGVIVGTLTLEETADGTNFGAPLTWRGTATAEVTLR